MLGAEEDAFFLSAIKLCFFSSQKSDIRRSKNSPILLFPTFQVLSTKKTGIIYQTFGAHAHIFDHVTLLVHLFLRMTMSLFSHTNIQI